MNQRPAVKILVLVVGLVACLPLAYTKSVQILDDGDQGTGLPDGAQEDIHPLAERRALYSSTEQEMESPLESIRNVKKAADDAALTISKSVGRKVGQYVKQKHMKWKQQEIVARFDEAILRLTARLDLNPAEFRHFVEQIENYYIEDAETGKYALDHEHFRDLPTLVKKTYSDVCLARMENGTVDTYYLTGELKTQWTIVRGRPEGAIVTHYKNGEIQYIDLYKSGRKINRKKYDSEGRLEFDQDYVYEPVLRTEEPAEPAGATATAAAPAMEEGLGARGDGFEA